MNYFFNEVYRFLKMYMYYICITCRFLKLDSINVHYMICLTVFKNMTDEIRQDIEDAGSHLKPWYVVSLNKILND